MPDNVVGKIPEFTTEEQPTSVPAENGNKEVKQPITEEVIEQPVKETPIEVLPPQEQPAGQMPSVDTSELLKQVQGLQTEREKLLEEIKNLRGTRRELKEAEIKNVEQQIDELKDLNPEDVSILDRILKSRGVVTKESAQQMFYNYVKQEELNKFLEQYPEYKPENDPNNINWDSLQREISFYRMPEDPHLIGQILKRAHNSIQRAPSGQNIAAQKHQAEIAGVGGGGNTSKPSSHGKLTSEQKQIYRDGGWSEEEIKQIENKLPE